MKFEIIDHVNKKTIEQMYDSDPVFVLTTGRSGSKFIVNFFNVLFSDQVQAFHEPSPVLENFPNYFYHNQEKKEELKNIFKASRMELILKNFISEKIYIESNQCLVFLLEVILELFPNAKFIHLIRNPIDFVISAARKGWYNNDTIWEDGRIKCKDEDKWQSFSYIEKLAWYWNETNQYIERFKSKTNPERFLTIKLEKLVEVGEEDIVVNLIKFCGLDYKAVNFDEIYKLKNKKINELIIGKNEPKNIKKLHIFPKYYDWSKEEQAKFKNIVKDLAKIYRYVTPLENRTITN